MSVSKAYLDTYYLLEVVMEGKAKADVKRLLSRISNPSFKIFIPQIVLGEALAKLFSKYDMQDLPSRLEKIARIILESNMDVEACLVPPKGDIFTIMKTIKERDQRLDNTDVLILSHALADADSKFFFTRDKEMLDNKVISEYEKELRDESLRNTKLKILDRLQGQ